MSKTRNCQSIPGPLRPGRVDDRSFQPALRGNKMTNSAVKNMIKDDIGATLAQLRALNLEARNSCSDPEKRHAYNRAILAKARKFVRSDHARRYMKALGGAPDEVD